MQVLKHLEPQKVFSFFESMCTIPHGSGNTKAISDWCVAFAKERGLEHYQDTKNNVIIIKEAAPGYEKAEPVILQGHLDMVCAKHPDCTKDMDKEGLDLAVDGDYVYAKGTTLGGDDGIAVAMALAILDDQNLPAPRIEAVFTIDEEIGLLGATDLDVSPLKGRKMLNLDSETEGIFTVSCAGGMECDCVLPAAWQEADGCFYEIWVDGLHGGHSGSDIHKERANSNILMGRLLCMLDEVVEFRLAELAGGLMDNAIPRSTHALLCVSSEETDKLEEKLREIDSVYKREYASADPDITVRFQKSGERTGRVLTPRSASLLLFLLHNAPNGVVRNSMDIPGLVQTSLNLGILKLEEQAATLIFSVRSSVESEKEELGRRLRHMTEFLGGTCVQKGDYPGWEYRQESSLRDAMVSIYERMYGKKPRVLAIHAGLECGFFSGKMEDLDCVSIGPDLFGAHTPEERLSISSTERVYEFILEVLKELRQA